MNATARDTRPTWQPRPYSEGQAQIIKAMCQERGITAEALRTVFPTRPTTFDEGSKVIAWIKGTDATNAPAQPSAPQASKPRFVTAEMLPEGNYAIPYNGKTHFYRVSHKEGKGKWAGTTFVSIKERASDVLYPMGSKAAEAAAKWSIVNYGYEASRMLFSEKLGECWHCTRALTDEDNPYKPHGLGPVCGPKVMG
jgi:hypothetical protein